MTLPPIEPDEHYDWSGGAMLEEDFQKPRPLLPPLGQEIPLYRTDDLSRSEWLSERKRQRKVGASNIAGIMQRHPLSSPLQEWGKITNQLTWEAYDEDERFRMDLGSVIEAQIRKQAAEALGVKYTGVEFRDGNCLCPWPQVLQHPRLDMFTCNLDAAAFLTPEGFTQPEKLVTECKWTGWRNREHWFELRDTLNPYAIVGTLVFAYYLQVQAQLSITGLRRGILIGIIGEDAASRMLLTVSTGTSQPYMPRERDVVVVFVERDEAIIEAIEAVVPRFYNQFVVRNKQPPETDRRDLESLRQLYREANPPKVTIDRPDLEHVAERYVALTAKLSQGERLKDDAKAKLLAAFVEDQISTCTAGRYKIRYQADRRGRRSLRVNEVNND